MNAVRLHKVRAGWYETTKGEPVEGTLAAIAYDHETDSGSSWYLARYEASNIDDGLDLVSTGDYCSTLADARSVIADLIHEGANA